MIRIFIVEDHDVVRESLVLLIEREQDMTVSGDVDSAEAALDHFVRNDSDLMLIDISLPGMSGIDLGQHVRADHPDFPFLMLSGHGESGHVDRALKAGAGGFVVKWDIDDLPEAIRTVRHGGHFLSSSLRRR